MLSTMTEEGDAERTEREILVPWLKFSWETYRSVLDILKTNSKLEKIYHETSVKAFDFCKRFERKTELRRLCDTLRQHLANLQRAAQQAPGTQSSKFRGWEGWTQEGVELHLTTRFAQLEAASKLELWTEAFRTVEDIHAVMKISTKPPKPKLLAKYFERLTKIFWVSSNYLFHAYTWWQHYQLAKQAKEKKQPNPEERTHRAACIVLAALCVPDFTPGDYDDTNIHQASLLAAGAGYTGMYSSQLVDSQDDVEKEKNARMALLLGIPDRPNRTALFTEILQNQVLDECPAHVIALYQALETQFAPRTLASIVAPLLDTLRNETPRLAQYAPALAQLAAARQTTQLGSVFSVMLLSEFHAVLEPLGLGEDRLDALVVGASPFSGGEMYTPFPGNGVIARFDFRAQVLRFVPHAGGSIPYDDYEDAIVTPEPEKAQTEFEEDDKHPLSFYKISMAKPIDSILSKRASFPMPPKDYSSSGTNSNQLIQALQRLRGQLGQAAWFIENQEIRDTSLPSTQEKLATLKEKRTALYEKVRITEMAEHERCLARKAIIERRKEEQERVHLEKVKAEQLEKERAEEERKKDEQRRLEREALQRNAEKLAKMRSELAVQEAKEVMKSLGAEVADNELVSMDESKRQKLIEETKEQAAKAKQAEEQRLAEQAKRIDYITRALRLEELPVLEALYTELCEKDRKLHDEQYTLELEAEKKQHAQLLAEKKRLNKLMPHIDKFEKDLLSQHRAQHLEQEKQRREAHIRDCRARKLARARRRCDEHKEELERQRIEQAENAAAAAERARKEEIERARRAAEEVERAKARDKAMADEAIRSAFRAEAEALRKANEEKRKRELAEKDEAEEKARAERLAAQDRTRTNWRAAKPDDSRDRDEVPLRRAVPPASEESAPYRPRAVRGFDDRRGGFEDGPSPSRRGGGAAERRGFGAGFESRDRPERDRNFGFSRRNQDDESSTGNWRRGGGGTDSPRDPPPRRRYESSSNDRDEGSWRRGGGTSKESSSSKTDSK